MAIMIIMIIMIARIVTAKLRTAETVTFSIKHFMLHYIYKYFLSIVRNTRQLSTVRPPKSGYEMEISLS